MLRLQQRAQPRFQPIHHQRTLMRHGYHRRLFQRRRRRKELHGRRRLIPRHRQPSLRPFRIRLSGIACWEFITSRTAIGLIASRPKIGLVFPPGRKQYHTASNHAASVRRRVDEPAREAPSARAREAGGSIKPGAQAPGSVIKRTHPAREAGGSANMSGCRPLRGLIIYFSYWSWGLRPRLYAYARFAGSDVAGLSDLCRSGLAVQCHGKRNGFGEYADYQFRTDV